MSSALGAGATPLHPWPLPGEEVCAVLTQKVHLAPNTQQAEQAGFTRAESNDDVPVNFS
jgi:hypothetical protein